MDGLDRGSDSIHLLVQEETSTDGYGQNFDAE